MRARAHTHTHTLSLALSRSLSLPPSVCLSLGTALIKDWKDVLTEVGDNQSLLLSLKESQYFSHFKDRATVWENRLVMLDDVLHLLNPIQRKWVYLEPIFGRGALPHEQARSL